MERKALQMLNGFRYGFLILMLSLTGCASSAADSSAVAPQPAKQIDAARFFTGRWYEIARTPMKLTDGCVAGTTDYLRGDNGQLIDRDACRMGTPEGKEKAYQGPVTILNPGDNNKVTVRYTVYLIVPVYRTYWMLDHGDDYQWFIVANPGFTNVSIFTRAAGPDPQLIATLTARVKALGYDPAKLEFPEQFPAS
jgi:apolipoprotein D and lipocalin family protein